MAHQEAPPEDPAADRFRKRKQRAVSQTTKRLFRKKTAPASTVSRPECIFIAGEGSCPEWQDLLAQYPMIDSVQREDFPDHGASFTYLAHFYRTDNPADEGSRALEEFRRFFLAIGYEYDSAEDFESRWFEGIGVKTSPGAGRATRPRKKRAT
ncbi:MAG: hypothetical protein LUO98_03110 [Methanoregula sp.]|nr:hypothetical protein [Methanoregula sp.]